MESSEGGQDKPRLVRISKSLSWLLRHGALESGVHLNKNGFAAVEEVLNYKRFKGVTVQDVRDVVASDAKGRYTLKEIDGVLSICANQGHSIPVEELSLTTLTSLEMCPQAIHGTFTKNIDSILKKGLLKMSRNHIHFSKVEPSDDYATSGIRPTCNYLIYLDVEKALKDGFQLFESANNVVLCPGNAEGCIPPEYFLKVRDRTPVQRGHPRKKVR